MCIIRIGRGRSREEGERRGLSIFLDDKKTNLTGGARNTIGDVDRHEAIVVSRHSTPSVLVVARSQFPPRRPTHPSPRYLFDDPPRTPTTTTAAVVTFYPRPPPLPRPIHRSRARALARPDDLPPRRRAVSRRTCSLIRVSKQKIRVRWRTDNARFLL